MLPIRINSRGCWSNFLLNQDFSRQLLVFLQVKVSTSSSHLMLGIRTGAYCVTFIYVVCDTVCISIQLFRVTTALLQLSNSSEVFVDWLVAPRGWQLKFPPQIRKSLLPILLESKEKEKRNEKVSGRKNKVEKKEISKK